MKKVLFLSLAVCAFGMMSCKKCQTCVTDVYQESNGFTQQVSGVTTEYCGDDYDDAPASGTTSQTTGSTTQTVTITCTDN